MRTSCFPTRWRKTGFTLVELLVVMAIIFLLIGVSSPIIATTMRDVRMEGAVARLRAGLQQTRVILADHTEPDRSQTQPRIKNAVFAGVALVVRWDAATQDYEVFYALHNQVAGVVPNPISGNNQYLEEMTPQKHGYSRLSTMESMTLGTGIRVAGLRCNSGGATPAALPTKLELVPGDSFAVCFDPNGISLPPAQTIYVNLQGAPPVPASGVVPTGPWSVWDIATPDSHGMTGMYDSTLYNVVTGVGGEGFPTATPMILVYRDDDLPLSGNSPSGTPYRGADGKLNPALDPNELLLVTRGRLVMLTLQGGAPVDF